MKVSDLILELIKMHPDMHVEFYENDCGNELNLGNVIDIRKEPVGEVNECHIILGEE